MKSLPKITPKQLDTLRLLYRFRFGTASLLAESHHVGKRAVNIQLTILLKNNFIKRQYGGINRLLHEEAVYSLDTAGRAVLAREQKYSKKVLTSIRTNPGSKHFIQHSLTLFSIYLAMHSEYGDDLVFLTKSNLAQEKFAYLPKVKPDAFISLPSERRYCFLYSFDSSTPDFALINRLAHLFRYEHSTQWEEATKSTFPLVIVACSTKRIESFLKRRLGYIKNERSSDITFVTLQNDDITKDTFGWSRLINGAATF